MKKVQGLDDQAPQIDEEAEAALREMVWGYDQYYRDTATGFGTTPIGTNLVEIYRLHRKDEKSVSDAFKATVKTHRINLLLC